MRYAKLRRWWLTAHLYLGLTLGGFFVLLGLTGSFIVFYLGIDEAIVPTKVTQSPVGNLPLEHVLDVLRDKFPNENFWYRRKF